MEYTLKITNLTCEACSKVSAMVLKKINGVVTVDIAADGKTKIVSTKPLDVDSAIRALKEKGYEAVTA